MLTFLFLLPFTLAFVPSFQLTHGSHLNLFVEGPSVDTKPDYENIHGPLGKTMDEVFLKVFRSKMADAFGLDSQLPYDNYQGLMELTAAMNARYSDKSETQRLAQEVLSKPLHLSHPRRSISCGPDSCLLSFRRIMFPILDAKFLLDSLLQTLPCL